MMNYCCENIPRVKADNDFSVKEIIFCIMALEGEACKAPGIVADTDLLRWKQQLRTIVPQTCYSKYAVTPNDKVHNWALFTAVSEYMRTVTGIGDTIEFIELQLASQMQWMDENGMYRDPHKPMVYDLVPRGLFSILLHFGYRGKYYDEIDRHLRKAGLMTLKMQSVTGEIPYGGRSNQFLHNEAHLAVIFEYEARRYAAEGNYELAGQFKSAVQTALENIAKWLCLHPVSHIKNRFSVSSQYGCECYAYFDKYMITTASFLYAAYLICDDRILRKPLDKEKPYTLRTSEHFHKIFLNAGGYFLEFDTLADMRYDASGLGRVHKKDAPSAICMSVPCSEMPSYTIDLENPISISLCPGCMQNGKLFFAIDRESKYVLKEFSNTDKCAYASFGITLPGKQFITATYVVNSSGVEITISGEGELVHMLPAFAYDGELSTVITSDERHLKVCYQNFCCLYTTNGSVFNSGKIGGNRNGHYHMYYAKASNVLSLKIEIYRRELG